MGTLTGQLIQGTGSYEVSEIAPPSVKGNRVPNWQFKNWTNDDPDDWTVIGTEVAGQDYITQNGNACRIVSGGLSMGIRDYTILTIGKYYRVRFYITESTSGEIRLYDSRYFQEGISGVGQKEYFFKAEGVDFTVIRDGPCDISFTNLIVEEVPEGYPLMDKGDKRLYCTVSGNSAGFASDQAYGEWEWTIVGGSGANYYFMASEQHPNYNASEGYEFQQSGATNTLRITKNNYGSYTSFLISAEDVVEAGVVYLLKITRTLDGEWSLYLKGGAYGDTWTLVDMTGGTGTNPIIENTYSKSKYFVLDLNTDDWISKLTMRKAVQQ
jgi:hypothetical protein